MKGHPGPIFHYIYKIMNKLIYNLIFTTFTAFNVRTGTSSGGSLYVLQAYGTGSIYGMW